MDQYKRSWQIYKEHSDFFKDDLDYYLNFCKGYNSLDLFAGYGRLTNYLKNKGVEIEAVELSPELANFIELEPEKKHIKNVLDISFNKKFERIIAGYNSFCLLNNDNDILKFFQNLYNSISDDGKISLNYYHTDHWAEAVSYTFEDKNGNKINYEPFWDLSEIEQRKGKWIDKYIMLLYQMKNDPSGFVNK